MMRKFPRPVFRTTILFPLLFIIASMIAVTPIFAEELAPTLTSSLENTHQTVLPLVMNGCCLDNWVMAGANPERTSWVAEEVRGSLKPDWYKPIEPYIPTKVQIVTAYDTLYISTSKGLYTLDAETGAEKWVYPTELPLGHSPTIYEGVAYVGGFDKRLHAVDAYTGQGLWMFEGGAGFDTNPLVVGGIVYAGNRDGYFYAVYTEGPKTGQLAWKYKTNGPIEYSAAYKDGVIFFASNDSHAYALSANTGDLVWKSAKLPGAGFYSWWPVIYQDWVIFSGSLNYRVSPGPGQVVQFEQLQLEDLFPNNDLDPVGTLVGPLGTESGNWASGTPTIDTSNSTVTENGTTIPITDYLETKPWRRTYFVLDRFTGGEYTTDFDKDGQPEYAPILWQGTVSGSRHPPVVGNDGVIYQANMYMSAKGIAGSQVVGWEPGTPFISIVSSDWDAVDEPIAHSGGGNLIYFNHSCDVEAGAYDIHLPNTKFADRYEAGIRPPTGAPDKNREWEYFNYDLWDILPGYDTLYYTTGSTRSTTVFGGRNGVYGCHGNQNPPIPYQGKVYMHRSNAVIAFAPQTNSPVALSLYKQIDITDPSIPVPTETQIRTLLADEVEKILNAGHLRPGYINTGIFDFKADHVCGEKMTDYWHNPGDILYTLIRALPYLSPDLQIETKDYLQAEFAAYPPYAYTHIGWKDGTAREIFDLPPEVEADRINFLPETQNKTIFGGWRFAPQNFYALWKYAEIFGNAKSIFDASEDRLDPVPSDDYLRDFPHVHNAYIAGYLGYLELEKLAGYPESVDFQQELNRLLNLRAATFSKDAPESWFQDSSKGTTRYCRTLNISHNFLYLIPELGLYLHDNALDKVQQAIDAYDVLAPYWFVSKYDVTLGEGIINQLYDYQTIFQAKALILKEPRQELAKYLDVPAVAIGDLFYIENLIATLEAGSN